MENNLDSNNSMSVPEEIKKWNWGAFFLSFIWGIAHKVYFSLLCFIPFVGLIIPFVLGAKGNEWAWEKNDWDSIEEFKKSQKKWTRNAVIIIVGVIVAVILMIIIMSYSLGKIGAVNDAVEILNNNSKSIGFLGENIEKGFWISGSVSISGPSGSANVSFPVEGTKGKGKAYMIAKKEMGLWEIERLVLEVEEEHYRFNLLEND